MELAKVNGALDHAEMESRGTSPRRREEYQGSTNFCDMSSTYLMGDNAAILQERVAMLEKLLEEKERTIKILMER